VVVAGEQDRAQRDRDQDPSDDDHAALMPLRGTGTTRSTKCQRGTMRFL
jgi:hypothetical protein